MSRTANLINVNKNIRSLFNFSTHTSQFTDTSFHSNLVNFKLLKKIITHVRAIRSTRADEVSGLL